ncbi:hypothetical protein [Anaerosporobacter sp.]|uniref:hypothetical protein n=1 Tax=Anaerosporobacter sp. TaxID=1872529 RepID=UPI00286ECC48|nr:hypothetical protein [Anaerosporobacter sp.]
MLKEDYKSGMNSFELREEKLEETRRRMESISCKQKESPNKTIGIKKYFKIAAIVVILLLIPTTVYAISKNEYLFNAFFHGKNVESTDIQNSIVTDSKTIVVDGLRFKIEEYLCDEELGIGLLVYSVESETGESLDKNLINKAILNEKQIEMALTTDTDEYRISYFMTHMNYEEETNSYKVYRKISFSYQLYNGYDNSVFPKNDGDIFVTFNQKVLEPDTLESDQLIKLDTSKSFTRFIWNSTEDINSITKIMMSPIGLRIEGIGEETSMSMIEKEIKIADITLKFKDGTNSTLKELGLVEENSERYSSMCKEGKYIRNTSFFDILNIDNLESISINGYEYK